MLHNLQAEIARKKVPQAEIAKVISVSDRTVRKKMTGETKFTFPEARKIRDTFFPDMELDYLYNMIQQVSVACSLYISCEGRNALLLCFFEEDGL